MGDSEIRLIDVETGTIVKKIKTSTNLRKVRCSPDGSTIAALDYDGLIHIIDLGTGIEKSVYQGGYYYDFSPDSKSLAYFDQKNGVLRIRNIKNGSIIFINEMKFLNYVREEYVVNSVRFSPDGKYIIILTGDNLNYVITIKEPYCFAIDGTNSEKTIHNSFSYNGKYFVSAKDKDVMVWDAETKQCMRVLKGHKEDVYSVAISPNGEFVVSTDKTSMLLWNVNEGVCMKEIDIPNLCAVFSPDSKEIILIQMDLVNQENYISLRN
jgi:WD40 repeat protein